MHFYPIMASKKALQSQLPTPCTPHGEMRLRAESHHHNFGYCKAPPYDLANRRSGPDLNPSSTALMFVPITNTICRTRWESTRRISALLANTARPRKRKDTYAESIIQSSHIVKTENRLKNIVIWKYYKLRGKGLGVLRTLRTRNLFCFEKFEQ